MNTDFLIEVFQNMYILYSIVLDEYRTTVQYLISHSLENEKPKP